MQWNVNAPAPAEAVLTPSFFELEHRLGVSAVSVFIERRPSGGEYWRAYVNIDGIRHFVSTADVWRLPLDEQLPILIAKFFSFEPEPPNQ